MNQLLDHLPIFAVIKITARYAPNQDNGKVMWRFYDEGKKEDFLVILEENLASINLDSDPDALLDALN